MLKYFLLAFLLFPSICLGLSPRLEGYMAIIEQSGEKVRNMGDILEILVRQTRFKHHPDDSVIGNLVYRYRGRTIGELDMVVIIAPRGMPTKFAICVTEMKLWKNNKNALKKAWSQLMRFSNHLADNEIDQFIYMTDKSYVIFNGQFSPHVDLDTYGPKGSTEDGFDYEFDITPEEGKTLFNEFNIRQAPRRNKGQNQRDQSFYEDPLQRR